MSSKKNFNKGMEAGLRISEGIIKREAEAMDYLKNKIDSIAAGQDNVREAVNDILEYQSSLAIEKYYGVCNASSPKDLEDAEKHVLLDILSTLAFNNDTNRLQKMYFANLKHYMEFAGYKPNTEYDFELIDNIRDLDSQEIILKCIREFGFLENLDFTFVDTYEELLDCFSVKNKRVREMDSLISITDYLFGEMGIVQMYGDHLFIAEEEDTEEVLDIKLEELVLTENINIGENEERTFENKAIYFRGKIECKGRLIFKNCQLHYFEKDIECRINAFGKKSYLEFDSCVIRSFEIKDWTYFIQSDSSIKIMKCIFEEVSFFVKTYGEYLQIEECEFINCCALIDTASLSKSRKRQMVHCYFYCANIPSYIDEKRREELFRSSNNTVFKIEDGSVRDCRINGNEQFVYNKKDEKNATWQVEELFEVEEIKNCSFENICMSSSAKIITGCTFKNCSNSISIANYDDNMDEKRIIEECLFQRCKYIMKLYKNVWIQKCQFSECESSLIKIDRACHIDTCQFFNITVSGEFDNSPYFRQNDSVAIFFNPYEDYDGSSIENCEFNGVKANKGFLIGVDATKKIYPQIVTMSGCTLKNASTLRESGSIIKSEYYYFGLFNKKHEETGLKIFSNCKGFSVKFPKDVSLYLDYQEKNADSFGNSIGASDDVIRGISGQVANTIYNGMAI